ncbi:hypothetical protein [Bacillus sp. Marseille-Q3570]|uniref:hypothetical protein n=1 Tax=Bacillus sp. Marseille-Q3570 TaxID=2963522 RepID=UPI0021B7B215|nr:hypothetical protein [Bacillus sp. Marseille-Q3570]
MKKKLSFLLIGTSLFAILLIMDDSSINLTEKDTIVPDSINYELAEKDTIVPNSIKYNASREEIVPDSLNA